VQNATARKQRLLPAHTFNYPLLLSGNYYSHHAHDRVLLHLLYHRNLTACVYSSTIVNTQGGEVLSGHLINGALF
jgi:hypothetical protein